MEQEQYQVIMLVGDLKYIEQSGIYEIAVYRGFPEEHKTYCTLECAAAIRSYLDFRKRYSEKIALKLKTV